MGALALFLFILANGVLFIRPNELVSSLQGLPFYELLIVATMVVAFTKITSQFTPQALVNRPITVFVLGLLVAVVLSHLSHLFTWGARMSGMEFAKLVAYYLLLVAVVDTKARLHRFLTCLVLFIIILTTLAVLQYHQVINIAALEVHQESSGQIDEWTGQPIMLRRLRSSGIFHDPNDLCMILIFGAMVCLYRAGAKNVGPFRTVWLLPIGLFAYALAMTHSRGGFLAMLASLMVLFVARFGWQRAIPLAAAILPAMFVLFAGRQTNITTAEGTGQHRIKIWSDGLQLFRQDPLFGIGQGRYLEEVGIVAHNSFIECYAELGFFGGTLFLGAFAHSFLSLYRLRRDRIDSLDPDLLRWRPFLMAVIAAYVTGFMSLSREYVVPAYLVLGLVTVYFRLAAANSTIEIPRLGLRVIQQSVLASVGFILSAYVFVRLFARFG